jgi:hypothetical protein
LAKLAEAGSVGSIHVTAEATSNFWLPFFSHLQQAELLSEWPLVLYPFNPRVFANFRKSFSDLDKTDCLSRFDYHQTKVASFAGLKWKRSQSGNFEAEETPCKRGGNSFLRYYLCEAAQHVRMRDAEYGAFYQRKYDEVPKHKHKRAIVWTARKLVRLVVRLLTPTNRIEPGE